jgi:hypothetical protein
MITDQFKKQIISVFGKKGEEWLVILPDILNSATLQWGLDKITPYTVVLQ